MLTNNDLLKIGKIVNEAIDKRVPGIVNEAIDKRVPGIVDNIVVKQLKPIKKQLDRMEKKLIVSFDHLDRRLMDHGTRLDRIDNHLHFDQIPETPPSKYIQRLQSQLAH